MTIYQSRPHWPLISKHKRPDFNGSCNMNAAHRCSHDNCTFLVNLWVCHHRSYYQSHHWPTINEFQTKKKNTINKEIKNKSDVKKPKRTPVLCFYFHSNGEKKEDKQIIKSHLFGHLWLNCFVLHTFCAIEIVNSISSTNILKRYEKNSYDFITAEIA